MKLEKARSPESVRAQTAIARTEILRCAYEALVDTVQAADPMGPRLCQLQNVPMTRAFFCACVHR